MHLIRRLKYNTYRKLLYIYSQSNQKSVENWIKILGRKTFEGEKEMKIYSIN